MLLLNFLTFMILNANYILQDDCNCKPDNIYGYQFEVKTQKYEEYLLELIIKVKNPNNNKSILERIKTDDDAGIGDCWFTDLDDDQKPEIFIWTVSSGSGSYGNLYVYEFDPDKMKLYKIETDVLQKREHFEGYMGHDRFYMESRYLLHAFPIYNEDDSNCCPTGGLLILIYELRNNRLKVVREIKLP